MKKETLKNWIIAIFILIIIFGSWYVYNEKTKEKRLKRETEIFNNGSIIGYNFALNQFASCQPIQVDINNQTITLLAIGCK